MRVAVHQPNYLPYLGFFHKAYLSDIFVLLDTAQFVKSGPLAWMNRNKIRTSQYTPRGWMWLTVPVLTKGCFPVTIKEALLDNRSNWQKKHHRSIYLNYHKAAHFAQYTQFFEKLYQKKWEKLALLNEEIIKYLLKQLEIPVKILKASELNLQAQGSQLLVDICQQLGADEYIYGKHGEDYMEPDLFAQNGIKLTAQNFQHPRYRQMHRPFIENLSVIDLLFNEGKNSIKILKEA